MDSSPLGVGGEELVGGSGEVSWVAVLLIFSAGGWMVAMNCWGAACRLFDFYSKNTVVSAATPRTLRLVGAVIGFLALTESIVEIASLV